MTMLMDRMQALEEDNARLRDLFANRPVAVSLHREDMFGYVDGVRLVPRLSGQWLMLRPNQTEAEPLDRAHLDSVVFYGEATFKILAESIRVGRINSVEPVTVERLIKELHPYIKSLPRALTKHTACIYLGYAHYAVVQRPTPQ